MDIFLKILFIILAYIVGSIPFGLIYGLIKGIDIRTINSGNIGATNVGRALGMKYAVITFISDMLKGALFVVLFRYGIIPEAYMVLSPAIYGIVAILGHAFPIFLKFKGGKCVATSAGAAFAYIPLLLPFAVITYFVTLLISKYSSLGSLISALLITIICMLFAFIFKVDYVTGVDIDVYLAVLIGFGFTMIYLKHIPNIKRLFKHEEHKINLNKKAKENKDNENKNAKTTE